MREHLVGYLLGALDPADHELMRARLEQDASLRRELELVERVLSPLAIDAQDEAPPPGLATRTCHRVARYVRRGATFDGGAIAELWRLPDVVVTIGILFVAGLLFFPAVMNSRNASRIAACQNNLRMLGVAMLQYSQQNYGYFPVVPATGHLAAAGAYAPILLEVGFLESSSSVVCPSSLLAENASFDVPRIGELEQAEPALVTNLQRTMGGSYGYSLGHVEHRRYCPTRNLAREQFALVADAPDPLLANGSQHHMPAGQNVLFEDGHVSLLKSCSLTDDGDHIFQNALGYVGAGLDRDDSVIATSATPPVMFKAADE